MRSWARAKSAAQTLKIFARLWATVLKQGNAPWVNFWILCMILAFFLHRLVQIRKRLNCVKLGQMRQIAPYLTIFVRFSYLKNSYEILIRSLESLTGEFKTFQYYVDPKSIERFWNIERFSSQVEKPARKNHWKIFDIISFQVQIMLWISSWYSFTTNKAEI